MPMISPTPAARRIPVEPEPIGTPAASPSTPPAADPIDQELIALITALPRPAKEALLGMLKDTANKARASAGSPGLQGAVNNKIGV